MKNRRASAQDLRNNTHLVRWGILVAALCLTLGVASYSLWLRPDAEPITDHVPTGAEPIILTLVHTNDTMGDLEPCG